MNEGPEDIGLRDLPVFFIDGKIGAEKKISNGVFMKHPMDQEAFWMLFKINPVIPRPIAQKRAPISRHLAELFILQRLQVSGEKLEFGKQV